MTVTSNIHVGLAGWSNATYTVGQRRSNAGNAYQVITAGTSTSPPTGTGSNITPGGTSAWKWLSAVDYSTLQAWANSIPSTLTQPIVGLVWNDAVITATVATAILTLSGHTTSSTNTITLAPATGEGFLATFQADPTTPYRYNNANGVSIEFPASGFGGINYIQIDDSNVIFRGMQVKDLNASSGATMIGGLGAIWLDKCLIEGQSQPSGARMLQMGAATIKITNSLIIDHSFGSPDSATIEAAGVGCAIAYSTIVKTAPATGSSALDANNNTTTASNTVIGCIFVGYDIPFAAASAQAWTTNHNAYTNSTFTSTSAATDTGGSIYSATTTSLFVNPTTDYHQNPTSPCLNAGVTDATDIPTADDTFGISRPQGANWDIGPHELLAGSVILRDFIAPCAFSRAGARDHSSSVVWNYGIARDVQAQLDFRASLISARGFATENKLSFPSLPTADPFSGDFSSDFGSEAISWMFDSLTPIEFRSGVPFASRDASFPLDWKVTIAGDKSAFTEWRSILQSDYPSRVDWPANLSRDTVFVDAFSKTVNINFVPIIEISSGIARDNNTSSEAAQNIISDVPFLTEIKASFPYLSYPSPFAREFSNEFGEASSWLYDNPTQIEFQNQVPHASRDIVVPLDWNTGIALDRPSHADWRSQFTQSLLALFEYSLSLRADGPFPVGSSSSLVGADHIVSVEAKATQVRNTDSVADWITSLTSSATGATDFGTSVINSTPVSYQFNQATAITATIACDPYLLLMADKVGLLDQSMSRSPAFTMPLETGGGSGAGVPLDAAISLEWRASVAADMTVNLSSLSSLRNALLASVSSGVISVVDYTLMSAFGNTPMMTIVAPSDWGHLTLGQVADMAASMEILASARVDVQIPNHLLVGQKSIGSQLEPDEWERENEPPC